MNPFPTYCIHCKQAIPGDASICPHCGKGQTFAEVPRPDFDANAAPRGLLSSITVSAQLHNVPFMCACCGGPPDMHEASVATRTTGKRVVRTDTRSLNFPYCARCVGHNRLYRTAPVAFIGVWVLVTALLAGLTVPFFIALLLGLGSGFGALAYVHHRAGGQCSPSCVNADSLIRFIGWYGSAISIYIPSQRYALAFMLANQDKLVNLSVSQQRFLMEYLQQRQHQSQASPPPPVTATPVTPPQSLCPNCRVPIPPNVPECPFCGLVTLGSRR